MTAPLAHGNSAILSDISLSSMLNFRELFNSEAPVEIDVGCGKGRFLAARSARFPEVNFIGIDKKTGRIRKVDRKLTRAGNTNVRLILAEAAYVVERLLPPQSVSAYYIFFPDPWPKRRHHRRRLFSPEFMDSLHLSLAPGGHIHIATDHLDYFAGIRKTLIADARFVQIEALPPLEEERTDFEIAFTQQNMPIGRCSFRKA